MIDNSVQDHDSETTKRLFTFALSLAVFTIAYNIAEGLVSTYIGFEDESLTLFGFGVDSFIEAISGLGIAHMVIRTQRRSKDNRDNFEKTALQITGYSFYILAIGLVLSSIYSVVTHHKPIATLWGIVISVISIGTMWALIAALYSPNYLEGAVLLRILVGSRLLARLFGGGENTEALLAMNNERSVVFISIAAAILNVALNIILVTQYGVLGVAAGTGISTVITNGSIWYLLRTTTRAPLLTRTWLISLAVGGIPVLAVKFLVSFPSLLQLILFGVGCLVLWYVWIFKIQPRSLTAIRLFTFTPSQTQ